MIDLGAATRDALLGGELILWQPPRGGGYRFNIDPVLLSGFAPPAEHVLDLGAGCGVLGLLLLKTGQARRVTAVEIQPELAALAMRNGTENGLSDRFDVITGDLRRVELPSVDAAVFNPPYFAAGSGRAPPDPGRGAARHELHGTLADFVRRAVDSVRAEGPISVVVRQERNDELAASFAAHGAAVVRRRYVVPRPEAAPKHVLVEARRGGRGPEPVLESPLIVHAGVGRTYSDELRRLLRE